MEKDLRINKAIALALVIICIYAINYLIHSTGCSRLTASESVFTCMYEVLDATRYDINLLQLHNRTKSISSLSIITTLNNHISHMNVIICTIMLDDDKLYVNEWIQYNKLLGFDMIHIYDNSINHSDYLANLSNVYKGFVTIQHYPGYKRQVEANNDCIQKYKHNNTWAAMIDTDEYIILHKHQNIKHLLIDRKPLGGSLLLNWVMFGNNHQLYYHNKSIIERFTERANHPALVGKSINYLPDIIKYTIHVPAILATNKTITDCHYRLIQPGHTRTPYPAYEDIAAIYHYYTKSYEEFEHKNKRGRANSINYGKQFLGPEGKALNHKIFADSQRKWGLDKNTIQDKYAIQFRNYLLSNAVNHIY